MIESVQECIRLYVDLLESTYYDNTANKFYFLSGYLDTRDIPEIKLLLDEYKINNIRLNSLRKEYEKELDLKSAYVAMTVDNVMILNNKITKFVERVSSLLQETPNYSFYTRKIEELYKKYKDKCSSLDEICKEIFPYTKSIWQPIDVVLWE